MRSHFPRLRRLLWKYPQLPIDVLLSEAPLRKWLVLGSLFFHHAGHSNVARHPTDNMGWIASAIMDAFALRTYMAYVAHAHRTEGTERGLANTAPVSVECLGASGVLLARLNSAAVRVCAGTVPAELQPPPADAPTQQGRTGMFVQEMGPSFIQHLTAFLEPESPGPVSFQLPSGTTRHAVPVSLYVAGAIEGSTIPSAPLPAAVRSGALPHLVTVGNMFLLESLGSLRQGLFVMVGANSAGLALSFALQTNADAVRHNQPAPATEHNESPDDAPILPVKWFYHRTSTVRELAPVAATFARDKELLDEYDASILFVSVTSHAQTPTGTARTCTEAVAVQLPDLLVALKTLNPMMLILQSEDLACFRSPFWPEHTWVNVGTGNLIIRQTSATVPMDRDGEPADRDTLLVLPGYTPFLIEPFRAVYVRVDDYLNVSFILDKRATPIEGLGAFLRKGVSPSLDVDSIDDPLVWPWSGRTQTPAPN
jgi:hypothetical protein